MSNLTREERNLRKMNRIFTATVIAWAILLVTVILLWVVRG